MSGVSLPSDGIVPVRSWRLYDVHVEGYGCEVFTAPTRGRALASAWTSPAFDMPFGDFLRRARATLRRAPLEVDGYDYVRRFYGLDIAIGERVTVRGEGRFNGALGTVLYPGRSTASVRVLFDGVDHPLIVHPDNIVRLGTDPTESSDER